MNLRASNPELLKAYQQMVTPRDFTGTLDKIISTFLLQISHHRLLLQRGLLSLWLARIFDVMDWFIPGALTAKTLSKKQGCFKCPCINLGQNNYKVD